VVARTGKLLSQFTLRNEPRFCAKAEREGTGDIHGHVEVSQLGAQLVPYVAPTRKTT
jgi:hypothetical protein